jgi:hypothetical protein
MCAFLESAVELMGEPCIRCLPWTHYVRSVYFLPHLAWADVKSAVS